MSFSVGILYSAQEFLDFVSKNKLSVDEFKGAFKKFSLAKPEDILGVTTKCNWVDFNPDGICRITERGKLVLIGTPEKNLRVQLIDLISVDFPPWAAKIPHGRKEALKFFPIDVSQCFKEAGLLGGFDEDVVDCWDKLSISARSVKSGLNIITGRKAERLTFAYEKTRVGKEPIWQGFESNFAGYDILSYSDYTHSIKRMIEVKGSTLSKKQAFCIVTRNEWDNAESFDDYRFHLWCLKDAENPLLIDIDVISMKPHIPVDSGDGKWDTVKVAYSCFSVTPVSFKI